MAKLKMLKAPKKPKLPRKPKATASVSSKENYIKRVEAITKKYHDKCRDVNKENTRRKSEMSKGAKLTTRIAGIAGIREPKSAKKR